jgi:hypothetical protein
MTSFLAFAPGAARIEATSRRRTWQRTTLTQVSTYSTRAVPRDVHPCVGLLCSALAPPLERATDTKMAPRGRGAGGAQETERRVLTAARQTLTESVPQTAAARRQQQQRLLPLAPNKANVRSAVSPGAMLPGQRPADRTVAHKVWPPASALHDASGLALPAPMQLVLAADCSVPPFVHGNEQLVTAPNTALGRSGPAQLGHRLATFERVSLDKYKRPIPDLHQDPLKYVPRPARELKPKPKQSGWSYTVPENLAAPTVRSTRRRSTRPNRGTTNRSRARRPHTSTAVTSRADENNFAGPERGETVWAQRSRVDTSIAHTAASWSSSASSRPTARTPDGTTSPRQFRLDTPSTDAVPWTRVQSQSRKKKEEEEEEEEEEEKAELLPNPKLAALRELRPGSHRDALGASWRGMSPNPFSSGPREHPREAQQQPVEQQSQVPEWAGAYHKKRHGDLTAVDAVLDHAAGQDRAGRQSRDGNTADLQAVNEARARMSRGSS